MMKHLKQVHTFLNSLCPRQIYLQLHICMLAILTVLTLVNDHAAYAKEEQVAYADWAAEVAHHLQDRPDSLKVNYIARIDGHLVWSDATEDLVTFFERLDYDLIAIRETGYGVPKIFVQTFPEDIRDMQQPGERKDVFVAALLPLILKANEEITEDRQQLLDLITKMGKGRSLSQREEKWLEALAENYETEPTNLSELLNRVDIVPPALALGQAAVESGWGTSRFVQEGNALYGQWTWRKADDGIHSEDPEVGNNQRIKAFPTLLASVRDYMNNLNTHLAYKDFRAKRQGMRRTGKWSPYKLADTLLRYSERKQAYTRQVNDLIKVNEFDKFDQARLGLNPLVVAEK